MAATEARPPVSSDTVGGAVGDPREVALAAVGITKTFPGTRALDGVDFTLRYGEVHALVGGNGSGKSTLIKILTGVHTADGGVIHVAGEEIDARQVKHKGVHDLGVRVVHQDLAMFPDLSVAENMMLGSEYPTAWGYVKRREIRRLALRQIQRFEISVSPSALVRDLPVAIRTQIAIARALQDIATERAVVILDEPTAALPAHEVRLLLDTIRKLAAQGHAVMFVSHRLDEVMAITDRVTVFRDGRVFAEHRTALLTETELIESIVGRQVGELRSGRAVAAGEAPLALSVRGLKAGPLRSVDLDVHRGEIVGIAGLLGSGRTELLRAVCGDLKISEGVISMNGERVGFSRLEDAIARGVVLIPEDRVSGAVFPDLSVDENMDVGVLETYWTWWGFRTRRMRHDNDGLRSAFRVKSPGGGVAMRSLSGGNQQKVVLARWMRRDPTLLLLDEPTQGVDVGARADIYAAIRELAHAGAAAVVVTSDLEELAQVVDRAVVLRGGRITAEVSGNDLSAQNLNRLIYIDGSAQ